MNSIGEVKWSELTDKDKVKLILQHTIPHDMGDDIVIDHARMDIVVPKGKRAINWPVAAWDDVIERWRIKTVSSNGDTVFNPLRDMNAAWQIVELEKWSGAKVKRIAVLDLDDEYKYGCYIITADDHLFYSHGKTAQEAICIASLMACGVEVEP